ncbi:DUF2828 domain-containing protein [Cephalotus follicularis]|uniref:DUF2828 domain-containing protein n=1 Tax=Cephalotus follicularis TaxID=3775 RepID=A0A1Q3D5Q8_CEPFO|nr:DUF2828 domain-containing protein [Cephalotus follicularis]
MSFTENRSPTCYSSGNPCLDFFYHVVLDTPPEEVRFRSKLAWEQNPLTALKLVCDLRGFRGTGKADREGFYASALWIHPKTVAVNAASIVRFGYFKDLPEILYRLLEGFNVVKIAWEQAQQRYYLTGKIKEMCESKIQSIQRMHWELNKDFQRVFDKILEVAKKREH